jgi:hypothetical protein
MKYLAMLLLLCAPAVHAADLLFTGGRAVLKGGAIAFEATLTQPYRNGYSFQEGLTYIGTSTIFDTPQPSKFQAVGRIVKTWNNNVFIGLGGALANRTDRYNGSCLNFNELIGITIADHVVIEFEHTSNAGLKSPNEGRNLLLVGVKF